MKQATSHNWQRLLWSGGVIAAWLLLLLPIWNANATTEAEPRTYLSCDLPGQPPASQSDLVSMVGSHGPVARVSQRPGFLFGPSLHESPCQLATFRWQAATYLQGVCYGCSYSFRFLQLIFEHQIAINAP